MKWITSIRTSWPLFALLLIGLFQVVAVSAAPVMVSLAERNSSIASSPSESSLSAALPDADDGVSASEFDAPQQDDDDFASEDDATLDARGRKHRKKKSKAKSRNTKKHTVSKKSHSGQGTFYNPGLGACGWHSKSHDMIAAISGATWGGGSHCGKSASVCHGSRCINVQIVDMCPGCSPGSLDLSPAAFKGLASLDLGVVPITWHYN